jgi:two-component system response regulator FlrC
MDSLSLVLIADNNEADRQSMAGALESAGFWVIQAIDGGSALKVVHEHKVAVAIIDHFMAPHGGFEFAKLLMVEHRDVPLILVTDKESSDLLIEARRYDISRFLKKPVDPARLVEAVRRAIREAAILHKKS